MAFIPEDGTGSATATSYIDVAYADLIAATDYIDFRCGNNVWQPGVFGWTEVVGA